jgi:hypothetical protein
MQQRLLKSQFLMVWSCVLVRMSSIMLRRRRNVVVDALASVDTWLGSLAVD